MASKILFRNVKIVDEASKHHNKVVDVYVEGKKISKIGKKLKVEAQTIDYKKASIFPAFCDLYADFCDPGFEHREDIDSGIETALSGGFTTVCTIPNTQPVVDSKSSVEYILNKAKGKGVQVLPLGAVSEKLKGNTPTEMYDMQKAGAVGFTDAPHPIADSGMLLRALQYVQPFNGVIFDLAYDENLSNNGQINEGKQSVKMGFKGVPHIAEVVQLKRNIEILRYAGGRLHVFGISTKEGVDLIKSAKKEGLSITASVFVHHLLFTDEVVSDYDSNYKIQPPFRLSSDRNALKKGLMNGVLDSICTQHTPVEIEGKKLEFEYATPGLIGLQTAYSAVLKAFEKENIESELVKWLSTHPRTILGLPKIGIEEGAIANFAIADAEEEWNYSPKMNASKSNNSPFLGNNLKGKIKAVYSEGKLQFND